ncbi:MAG: hypothetical protein K0B02_04530, partial [DPANN group archaeon]|nr:hypothetical protein [DPANN group archaeon]
MTSPTGKAWVKINEVLDAEYIMDDKSIELFLLFFKLETFECGTVNRSDIYFLFRDYLLFNELAGEKTKSSNSIYSNVLSQVKTLIKYEYPQNVKKHLYGISLNCRDIKDKSSRRDIKDKSSRRDIKDKSSRRDIKDKSSRCDIKDKSSRR